MFTVYMALVSILNTTQKKIKIKHTHIHEVEREREKYREIDRDKGKETERQKNGEIEAGSQIDTQKESMPPLFSSRIYSMWVCHEDPRYSLLMTSG